MPSSSGSYSDEPAGTSKLDGAVACVKVINDKLNLYGLAIITERTEVTLPSRKARATGDICWP